MKILHIGKYYPPFSGGIENFMGKLLPLLAQPDKPVSHQICALVHDHQMHLRSREETIDNVRIIRVPSYGRLFYAPLSPTFAYYLRKVLKQFKPDIIHIHMPNTSAFWLLFSSMAKQIPWVIHWHSDVVGQNLGYFFSLANKLYVPLEKQLLKQSRKIIVTSPNYLQTSAALSHWPEKTQIIPLGLKMSRSTLNPDSLQEADRLWRQTPFKVLSIGRLTYYKGHQYLIQAMQQLPDSRLIIVGQGEEYKTLNRLIKNLHLEHQVQLSGKVSNKMLHALLASCDVFCLPSIERTEAFGLVLLEAMSFAKPLLVSNLPGSGMTWVCQEHISGLFAKPGDRRDLARQLLYLQTHPALRKTLGENAWLRLNKYFTLDRVAEDTAKLYQAISSQPDTSNTSLIQ